MLRQFFNWLRDDEKDIDHHPMERVKQPKAQKKLVPIIRDDDTRELIDGCEGKSFAALRDEAIIRLHHSTGRRHGHRSVNVRTNWAGDFPTWRLKAVLNELIEE